MPRPSNPDLDLQDLYDLAVDQPSLVKTASSGRLKFAENASRFSRIGFDLFRDTQSEFIWKLEKDSETGEEFIIRTASVDPIKKSSAWQALADSSKTSIVLTYKGHPVTAFKKAELQFDESNIDQWRQYLVDKITTDPTFLNKVLVQAGDTRKRQVLGKFPELLQK
jgi:hypothetical protein